MYSEDIDLATNPAGWLIRITMLPEAEVIHFGEIVRSQAPSNFSRVMMRESSCDSLRNPGETLRDGLSALTMLCPPSVELELLRSLVDSLTSHVDGG